MKPEPITTPHLEPLPLREAMNNLEFITGEQLRLANTAMSSLAAEVDMLRRENSMLRTERNFLQAYVSDINASLDIMQQINDRVRDQAKEFAVKAATPQRTETPTEKRLQVDPQSEQELRDLMSRIPAGAVERMPDRSTDQRLPPNTTMGGQIRTRRDMQERSESWAR